MFILVSAASGISLTLTKGLQFGTINPHNGNCPWLATNAVTMRLPEEKLPRASQSLRRHHRRHRRRRRKVANAAMAKWCLFYAWKDSLSTPHQLRLLHASLGFIKNAHFWQDTGSVVCVGIFNVFKSHLPSYMCILLSVGIQALEKSASHNFFSYDLSMLLQQTANFLWWSDSLHLFATI